MKKMKIFAIVGERFFQLFREGDEDYFKFVSTLFLAVDPLTFYQCKLGPFI